MTVDNKNDLARVDQGLSSQSEDRSWANWCGGWLGSAEFGGKPKSLSLGPVYWWPRKEVSHGW